MKSSFHNSLRALFLSLAVLLSLPMLAEEIGGINYYLNAETKQAAVMEKSINGGGYSGKVVIPKSVKYKGTAYSVTSIWMNAFMRCHDLTSVTIPNSVTDIGDYAFYWCDGLTSVTIGNSVTSIGDYAFYNCTGLTSVTIPNSVTSIGEGAFYDCSGLTSVTIGNSVTSIGLGAFYNCTGLTSVTFGNSVTWIAANAFYNCYELLDVYCYAEKVPSTGNGVFGAYYPSNVTLHVPAASIGSYKATEPWKWFGKIVAVPTEIDGIGYVLNAETTQAAVIAKSSGGYSGEVVIPESVEHEGTAYSVTSIGDYAFRNCYGLTSVTIPNSVTSIGDYAFKYCSGLTSVTIGNSVTSIGYQAFYNCYGLTSVTIPNSVTSIGESAFYWCSGLTSVTIPNSVTSIGNYAFYDCDGLTSVTIGSSVTSIGYEAFRDCPDLLDVYCYAENVPSTKSNAFEGSYPEYITLHVPDASIESYKATEPWRWFRKIVALTPEETGIDELKGENGKVKTALYDLSGRRVQKGQKGVFIQNGKVMVR